MRPTATKSYMNVTLKPARKSLFNQKRFRIFYGGAFSSLLAK